MTLRKQDFIMTLIDKETCRTQVEYRRLSNTGDCRIQETLKYRRLSNTEDFRILCLELGVCQIESDFCYTELNHFSKHANNRHFNDQPKVSTLLTDLAFHTLTERKPFKVRANKYHLAPEYPPPKGLTIQRFRLNRSVPELCNYGYRQIERE